MRTKIKNINFSVEIFVNAQFYTPFKFSLAEGRKFVTNINFKFIELENIN